MSETNNSNTIMKMFVLVSFFILLFGGAAIYAAYQTKNLKAKLEKTERALEECQKMK